MWERLLLSGPVGPSPYLAVCEPHQVSWGGERRGGLASQEGGKSGLLIRMGACWPMLSALRSVYG